MPTSDHAKLIYLATHMRKEAEVQKPPLAPSMTPVAYALERYAREIEQIAAALPAQGETAPAPVDDEARVTKLVRDTFAAASPVPAAGGLDGIRFEHGVTLEYLRSLDRPEVCAGEWAGENEGGWGVYCSFEPKGGGRAGSLVVRATDRQDAEHKAERIRTALGATAPVAAKGLDVEALATTISDKLIEARNRDLSFWWPESARPIILAALRAVAEIAPQKKGGHS